MGRRRAKPRKQGATEYTPEQIREAWVGLVEACDMIVKLGPEAIEPVAQVVQKHAEGKAMTTADFLTYSATALPMQDAFMRLTELIGPTITMLAWGAGLVKRRQ